MNYLEVIESIQKRYTSLSDDCIQDLLGELKIKSYTKNEIFVREGQFSTNAFFIISGSARAYYYKNDKDVSDWFAFENEFISPIVSFFSDKPSAHYLQVMEDSILAEISKEKIEELAKEHRELEKLIRVIVTETMQKQVQMPKALC